MTDSIVDMIDAEHINVPNIPHSTPKVAGYDTQANPGDGIEWSVNDWTLFPQSGHVHIDQSPSLLSYGNGVSNVADVERYAGLITTFVTQTQRRIANGHMGWIYASRSVTQLAATACESARIDLGKVGLWLADWNLSRPEAQALIGTKLNGFRIVAVQWASPSSNPHTLVPGSLLTLSQANVDLSVALGSWFPPPAPKPVTPPPVKHKGIVVLDDLTTYTVTTSDRKTFIA